MSAEAAGFGFSVSGSTRPSGSSGADAMVATEPAGDLVDALRLWRWVTSQLALVQAGASSQRTFVNWAERDLLPALRKLG